MFFWNSADLNREQEDAIREPENVLLIACPGSGKTRALTYKIAYELEKLQSKKKYIVAITYTNNAAEEIKERIELLGVDTTQLWIGTIHSFCTEWILRPYSLYLEEIKYGFRIMNSHETELLLNSFCSKTTTSRLSFYDCQHTFFTDGYRLTNASAANKANVEKVLDQYWDYLSENRFIDFELILYYSYLLLNNNPFITKILSQIFSYILIDEFQDTKELQYVILSKIIAKGNQSIKSFVVGDPNQSIYGSLGGYAIARIELEKLTGCKFIAYELSENYRSSVKIIEYFDHFKTFPNKIIGAGKNKSYLSQISYNDTVIRDDLENEIVRLILYNIQELSISPNEICVVAPQWVHLAAMTRNLMVKMPDYSFNGPGMAPFSRDIDNFFYKLCRIVLTEPAPNLYITRLRWGKEILNELSHAGANTFDLTPKLFLKYCNSIHVNEPYGLDYLKKMFEEIFKSLHLSIDSYESLAQDYHSFFESSAQRIERLKSEGNEFISTTENFKKVFKQRDGITISTMHGVKGLEFDTVIAFGLLNDWVPHFNDPNKQSSANKLLYVIASRARLNLHLISERRQRRNWNPPQYMISTPQLFDYPYGYDSC